MDEIRPRARELGIRIGQMDTGRWNAITDVPGVKVGQVTLRGGGEGNATVRTGVTAILPHDGSIFDEKVPAAVHTINGYGKATGFEQVRELGVLETPVVLTNTLSIGAAWDALVTWTIRKARNPRDVMSVNPLVGECNDGYLNDIQGRHVREEDVLEALDLAASRPVAEGAVGAGTGMSCYEFKGGIGTASRRVGDWMVGVLLVSNFGRREQLIIDGVPIGLTLRDWKGEPREHDGSVMMVVATDAPLSDRQLGRIARRTGIGLARTGSTVGHSSGDFAVAFSTAYRFLSHERNKVVSISCLAESELNPFFQAVTDAIEEAVLNSLFKAETTYGQAGHVSPALPIEEVKRLFPK